MTNESMKKTIQRVSNLLIRDKKYSKIKSVEIYFTFGSPHRTAMCDWVYGMKIKIDEESNSKEFLVKTLQSDIKKHLSRFVKQPICCTDVIYSKG